MTVRSLIDCVFAALLFATLVCSLAAQDTMAGGMIARSADTIKPLGVGDRPQKFVVESVESESVLFDARNLERPVVLLTFRGGWCPYCNMHLSEVRHVIPEIKAMGMDVIFLSGDRAELLYASLSQETQEDIDGLDYTILSDANAEAAIALGVAFEAGEKPVNWNHQKGNDIAASSMTNHGALPVPAVFAIDKDGVIQFAYVNANYKVRLPSDELLAAAREIAAAE